MVPPGRVMYLRRFKASPNACPIKQEEHRQRARARHYIDKANNSRLGQRLSSSGSSLEDESGFSKLKQRLSSSSSDEGESSHHQRSGDATGHTQAPGDGSGPHQQPGDGMTANPESGDGTVLKQHPRGSNESHKPVEDERRTAQPRQQSKLVSIGSDPVSMQRHGSMHEQTQQENIESLPRQQRRKLLQVLDHSHTDSMLGLEENHQDKMAGSGDDRQHDSGRGCHQPVNQHHSQDQGHVQDQNQDQRQDQRQDQSQDQANDQTQDQSQDQRQDQCQLQANDQCQDQANDQDEAVAQGQEETAPEEEADYYRQAGLQKPKGPTEGLEASASGWGRFRHVRSRRKKTKALHASLMNPKDLFWDAVWIEPEDIIREV